MWSFLLVTSLVGVIAALILAALYLYGCFTSVKEGTAKIVVRFGAYRETLLAKEGYKIDSDDSIVELTSREEPKYPKWMGGLRWVSLLKPFGVDRIYATKMVFRKSKDGKIKDYDVEGVEDFLAKVDYPYAVPFVDCEDAHNIPITGHATLVAYMGNIYKSLFVTTDFYGMMAGLVLPAIRECFEGYKFSELDEKKKKKDLDKLLWEYLSDPAKNPQPGGSNSVVNELWEKYGIKVVALRVVQLDPPPDLRETTVAKRKAQIEADRDMEATAGRILKSVAKASGIDVDDLVKKLVADPKLRGVPNAQGGFKEDFDYAKDQVKRDRAGAGLRDVRVGNADGTPLDSITAALTTFIGLAKGGGDFLSGGKNEGGGQGDRKKKSRTKKKIEDMDSDELEDAAEED